MRHHIISRKFNRDSSHRKLMFKSMANSLLYYEFIKTTLPKAKSLRLVVEPLITFAKLEYVFQNDFSFKNNNYLKSKLVFLRRKAFDYLRNKFIVKKLFEKIAPRYKDRLGGYTRILKCGYRLGDKAPMAYIEFVSDFNKER